MDWSRLIRDKVSEAEARVMQFTRNIVQVTTVTRSTAKGDEDGADGWPDAGKAYQRSPRRMQHFGFRSRPPKNSAAVMLLVGGGNGSEITVAEGGDGYGPTDLADGEAALYSKKTGATIIIRSDGKIEITPGAGADIVLNGGTAKVNRSGDAVNRTGTFALWITALRTSITGIGGADPGDCPAQLGVTSDGATNVKA